MFVGYPDWWSDAPMLLYSFLESYDWKGKTLIPFCTSGGSGFGRSLDNLPASAPSARAHPRARDRIRFFIGILLSRMVFCGSWRRPSPIACPVFPE